MAKQIIEARVIQKVGTEAEWLQNDLVLYEGEIALVSNGDNVVNMKVGDGVHTFAELEYMYRGGFQGSINPTTNTTSLINGFYIAETSGTYTNANNIVVDEGYFTILEKNDSGWKVASSVKMPVFDSTEIENKVTQIENISKIGGVRDWAIGSYSTGEIVRHNNLLWEATTNISTAEPGKHLTGWKLYNPNAKAVALCISTSSTLTIDLVTNKAIFTGASTNKIVTEMGVFSIPAQTIDLFNGQYFCFVFNSTTKIVRTVPITDDTNRSLSNDDYIFGYVSRLTEPNTFVYGIQVYTLIKSTGTTVYPMEIPEINIDVLYNRNFDYYNTLITREEKEWLNKAIINVEFYNLKDNQTAHLYVLGKMYGSSNLCYLGLAVAETGVPTKFIHADEFNNDFSVPFDANIHTGVKTYLLRWGSNKTRNSNILAKITIDWDAVPDGKRVVESNANVANVNSRFLREKIKTSYYYNNQFGKVKFSKSKSFYEYYNAPIIESYSSGEGVSSMIPKSPFERVENWYLKWDELITNKPDGYEIIKETLTTQVPTDTTESGFLPIYSYSFKPNKLKAGDGTANNSQTLPKILIDCSIHGFEKIPSFIVYEFLNEMLFNWRTHPFLEYLRFNVEFVIIPSANPHGWNASNGAGTRVNYNQVDLNRNNKIGWSLRGSPGDSTYSGTAPLSEIETQVLYDWMINNNTGNVLLGIDFHNFHGTPQADPKNYDMVWIINKGSELGQSCSNVLIKELSVKFKEKSTLIPQTDDYFVGTSNNFSGEGQAGTQYKQLGATYGCTFEVAQNFRFDSNFKGFDSNAMTFGLEAFVNFLRVYIDAFIDEFNNMN